MKKGGDAQICTQTEAMSATAISSATAQTDILKRNESSSLNGDQQPLKRIKLDNDVSAATSVPVAAAASIVSTDPHNSNSLTSVSPETSALEVSGSGVASSCSLSNAHPSDPSTVSTVVQDQCANITLPLKATHFRHLQHKYLGELDYMLREFQKLERQLLGAKTAKGAAEETAGSRERREKLHAFILHLEETIQQIRTGCDLEAAGKPTCTQQSSSSAGTIAIRDTALSTHLAKEKEEEENVQKLEEHILANLLPVKVRLKKQLAAQQGAKHNPAGMPTVRGAVPATKEQGKATFLKPLPEQQRRPSQFGQPLKGGGSSLTQKLHGSTLGVVSRSFGNGVGQVGNEPAAKSPGSEATGKSLVASPVTAAAVMAFASGASEIPKRKVLYGGMALGSTQIQSSVSAANTVHNIVIRDPVLLEVRSELHAAVNGAGGLTPTSINTPISLTIKAPGASSTRKKYAVEPAVTMSAEDLSPREEARLSASAQAAILSYEERRKQRKKRRKKKRLLMQQRAAAAAAAQPKRKKVVKKRGPRNVEYLCALCNEVYNSTCEFNPWWALSQHECPKCHKMQIPRVDIAAPANAIEYHPALLAHADENGGSSQAPAPESVVLTPPNIDSASDDSIGDFDSDLSDDDGLLSDDDEESLFDSSEDDSDLDDFAAMSPADRAEHEKFGLEYDGPKLTEKESARLLNLMLHASTCPCR
jgi:hypothetical protein